MSPFLAAKQLACAGFHPPSRPDGAAARLGMATAGKNAAPTLQTIVLIAEGLGTRQIADRLVISPNTVKAHVK
jgi:DNA-binding NarL/FixJ family response regulator